MGTHEQKQSCGTPSDNLERIIPDGTSGTDGTNGTIETDIDARPRTDSSSVARCSDADFEQTKCDTRKMTKTTRARCKNRLWQCRASGRKALSFHVGRLEKFEVSMACGIISYFCANSRAKWFLHFESIETKICAHCSRKALTHPMTFSFCLKVLEQVVRGCWVRHQPFVPPCEAKG